MERLPLLVRAACYIGISIFGSLVFMYMTGIPTSWVVGLGFGIVIMLLTEVTRYLDKRTQAMTFAERDRIPFLGQQVLITRAIYMREGERVGVVGTRGRVRGLRFTEDNGVLVELVDPDNLDRAYGEYRLDELKEA